MQMNAILLTIALQIRNVLFGIINILSICAVCRCHQSTELIFCDAICTGVFFSGQKPLVDGGVALGTIITVCASDIMHPLWRFVDAMEFGELLFGWFMED